jgi:hypothetical protein
VLRRFVDAGSSGVSGNYPVSTRVLRVHVRVYLQMYVHAESVRRGRKSPVNACSATSLPIVVARQGGAVWASPLSRLIEKKSQPQPSVTAAMPGDR